MAWTTPKTDWASDDPLTHGDMNEIGVNLDMLMPYASPAAAGDYIIPGFGERIAGLVDRVTQSGGLGSYQKSHEFKCPVTGTLRICFYLWSSVGGQTVYGQIYLNGSAAGTERSTDSASAVKYTEDIAVERGDLVQLYAKHGVSSLDRETSFALCHSGYGELYI